MRDLVTLTRLLKIMSLFTCLINLNILALKEMLIKCFKTGSQPLLERLRMIDFHLIKFYSVPSVKITMTLFYVGIGALWWPGNLRNKCHSRKR